MGSQVGLEIWEPSGPISVYAFICVFIKNRYQYDIRIAVPQAITRHWLCGKSIAKDRSSFPRWSLRGPMSIKQEPDEMWVSQRSFRISQHPGHVLYGSLIPQITPVNYALVSVLGWGSVKHVSVCMSVPLSLLTSLPPLFLCLGKCPFKTYNQNKKGVSRSAGSLKESQKI